MKLSKKASSKLDGWADSDIINKDAEFFCFLARGTSGANFTDLCIQADEVFNSGIFTVRIKPENLEMFLELDEVINVEWSRDMSWEASNLPAQ